MSKNGVKILQPRPPEHKWTDPNEFFDTPGVGLPNYDHISTSTSAAKYMRPVAPKCPDCGLPAEADNRFPRWWCHFCEQEILANYSPQALLPESASQNSHLEANISDKNWNTVCPKCASTMKPRTDNQGWECVKCTDVKWNRHRMRNRPGPIM